MSTDYYRAYARSAAVRNGVNPDIFEAQIQQESGFNPSAQSPAGAIGIAQIMPGTAKGWGVDPTNPTASLDAAAKAMAHYLAGNGGNYADALARYNAGSGNVDNYGLALVLSDNFAGGETKRYVANILRAAGIAASDSGGGTTTKTTTSSAPATSGARKVLPTLGTAKVGEVFGQPFNVDLGPLARIGFSIAAVVLVFYGVTRLAGVNVTNKGVA